MRIRPIGHDDRLSVVDHLDELRSRLIACGIFFLVAFLVCFWQNHRLIHVLNRALPAHVNSPLSTGDQQNRTIEHFAKNMGADAAALQTALASSKAIPAGALAALGNMAHDGTTASKQLQHEIATQKDKPLTIGVGESFTSTLMVVAYFALLISLPMILYQIYAFVLPALHPHERGVALPAMIAAPLLFVIGAVFTYFEILPPAVHFLQGYNSNQFTVLAGANSYYKFEVFLMGGIGMAFEIPLILAGLQRVGVVSASMLTGNWRYAILIIAVVVAMLPGVDPVTMIAECVPLVALYLASVVLLTYMDRRDARKAAAEATLVDSNAV